MAISTLQDALIEEMRDILYAEKQLLKALPKMAKAASSEELSAAFQSHLKETQQHVQRLEEAFESLDETARAKTCEGMKGIIEEGAELIKEHDEGAVLDAMLIAAAQKVEHYEIATYGTLAAWAEQLGHSEAAELFTNTLDEEKAADEKLTEIARTLNEEADRGVGAKA